MKSLVSASVVLSLTLLLGRLSGFVREIQLGAIFGLSREGDFAIVMLTTPDLLVNLLLAGGLSAALVPEFARLDACGRARVFGVTSLLVLALFGTIGIVLAFFPSLLLLAFAPGYAGTPPSAYALPYAIAAMAIPLAGLTGVTSALLNSQHRFFVAGTGTLVFNLTIILVLLLMSSGQQSLLVLGIGLALAASLRYMSQVVAALPHMNWAGAANRDTDYRRLAFRFIQALGAATIVLFIPVILRALISLNGEGNIAAFNFATKLVELPLGIAITTISTVAFPALSRAFGANNGPEQLRIYESGIQRALLLALCITIPGIWFSYPLVELVFGRGRIGPSDLSLISDLARLGFLTLPLISVSSMATVLLNARGQTGLLLKVTLASVCVVPLAALPGIWNADARFVMAALPVFHFVYAIALVLAAQQPVFAGWYGAWRGLFRPALAAVTATTVCAMLASVAGTDSAIVGASLALAAMLAAVVASDGNPLRTRTP